MYGVLEPTKRNKINAAVSAVLTIAFLAGVIVWSAVTSNPCSSTKFTDTCAQWMRENPTAPETVEFCRDKLFNPACKTTVIKPEYLNSSWQGLSGVDR